MKTLLRLSVLLLTIIAARADLVIEQKVESQLMNGNKVMKIKGEQARIDIPSPVGGGVSLLIDLKNGKMATLIHSDKTAKKLNLEDARKAVEAQQKATGVDLAKLEKPKATGTMEKVGEWNCEIFEVIL